MDMQVRISSPLFLTTQQLWTCTVFTTLLLSMIPVQILKELLMLLTSVTRITTTKIKMYITIGQELQGNT